MLHEFQQLQKAAESSQYLLSNSAFSLNFNFNFGFLRKLFSKNGKKKFAAASENENLNRSIVKPTINLEAQIADENLSNPSDFAKINEAGLLFIKRESPSIYQFSQKFVQEFKPLSNTVSFINTIFESLTPILATTQNGLIGILIEEDDLKIPLLQCFTTFLKSKPTKNGRKYEWQSPLIIKANAVAWLKCDLDITVKQQNAKSKTIEAQLNYYSFYFPTVHEFDKALLDLDAEVKDGEGTLL
uniref:Uncharacterized protein n=1 Tax=Panagrolaimus sp. ES5 TaxID=591445 RepID=A0AC34F6X8_9BILA